jgi:hypothetical protein
MLFAVLLKLASWYSGPLQQVPDSPRFHRGCVAIFEFAEQDRWVVARIRNEPLTVLAAEHRYVGYRISIVRGDVCVSNLNTLFGPGEDDVIWGLLPNRGDAMEFALAAFAAAGVTPLPPRVLPHWTPAEKADLGSWKALIARARREIPEEKYVPEVVRDELRRLGRPVPSDL